MRGVFCELDADDDGAVEAGALRTALRRDERLGELMRHWVGPEAWGESQHLLASDPEPSDKFGGAVSISASRITVGAVGDDDLGSASGAVYAFQRQSGGQWTQTNLLVADDGERVDEFGKSVGLDGNTAIIGKCMPAAPFVCSSSKKRLHRRGQG